MVDKGKATLRALEVELDEEQAEIASPIIVGHYEPRGAENEGGAPSAARGRLRLPMPTPLRHGIGTQF